MDKMGKRFLHGFLGAIAGFLIGIFLGLEYYEFFLWAGIAGAIIGGLFAFFMLDKFWEELSDYFSGR
jgi:hypothetical protein